MAETGRSPSADDQGSATAELAVALPAVVLGLAAVLGVGHVALAQLACVDAARAGARLAARGETDARVLAAARETSASPSSRVTLTRGRLVTVVVRRPVHLLGIGPTVMTQARARAEPEQPADGGSATVLVLATVLVAVVLALLVGGVAVAVLARHRAVVAADLAALAGAAAARSSGAPCERARSVAGANGAALQRCAVTGQVVQVRVAVRPPGPVGRLGLASASAAAGPSGQASR
ncbi:Rv3654c family TadE-like protein [Angustibacter luteus]|uniref:Rv3654c family TadE-like protein n=1 Tax=Angustibacter luteus TaxID=658456 RepID=A0ABW1JCI4_9ACTN